MEGMLLVTSVAKLIPERKKEKFVVMICGCFGATGSGRLGMESWNLLFIVF